MSETSSSWREMINSDSPTNEIWINRRRVDPRQLRPNIQRLHAENPQGSVIVQADKAANVETLVLVMDAAREVGVDVSLAADEV